MDAIVVDNSTNGTWGNELGGFGSRRKVTSTTEALGFKPDVNGLVSTVENEKNINKSKKGSRFLLVPKR